MRTTTTTERDVSWERRKAWPLLLGGAVALTGLSAVNYSWADPDGRLTDKAQDALSAKFPGAKVRVHGRDAIITGLPAGASVDVAHDLVRDIEGVRNVKEHLGSVAAGSPADTTATESVAAETVAGESSSSETVAEAVATEPVAAETVAEAVAVETVEAVAAETVAETPVATQPPATQTPVTQTPVTSEAPTTTVPDAPPTTVGGPEEAPAEASASDAPPVKIRFDSVSSTLVGESETSVDQLAAYLASNPDVRIKVVGHADTLGTRLTNLAISRARADAVVSSLVAGGIDRTRISAFARGDRLPVESNATAEGRRANRRVDIVFFGAEGAGDRVVSFTG